MTQRWRDVLVALGLALVAVIAYWPVQRLEFLSYDDQTYVTNNAFVRTGLSLHNMALAFSSVRAGNWHPVTWVSHMIDCELHGLNPWGHHLTNALLHTANCVLLFWVLQRMTRSAWPSALTAALFAVHPIHVESVAWVAERKDVLSTWFWMLSLWAYVRYTERPGVTRYLALVAAFALGLMAKPMVVTLPVVLLLLDYWPLGRMCKSAARRVFAEKVPLLVMSVASGVITYNAQRRGGAVTAWDAIPFGARVENALVSYTNYMLDVVWPHGLTVLYPHPAGAVTVWQAAAAGAILLSISALGISQRKRWPYLTTGWFWFLVTLLPVIGLIQVGIQARADRYMYIPSIGLGIMIAWAAKDASEHPHLRRSIVAAAAVVIIILTLCTRRQITYWRDGVTLFTRAVERHPDCFWTHTHLATALAHTGRMKEAEEHYREAVRLQPDHPATHFDLGTHLLKENRLDDAIAAFHEALRLRPEYAPALTNLALALATKGDLDAAAQKFEKVTRITPRHARAHYNLGAVLMRQGKYETAAKCFSEALRLNPRYGAARNALEQAKQQIHVAPRP